MSYRVLKLVSEPDLQRIQTTHLPARLIVPLIPVKRISHPPAYILQRRLPAQHLDGSITHDRVRQLRFGRHNLRFGRFGKWWGYFGLLPFLRIGL
jgi:hypothetical protein